MKPEKATLATLSQLLERWPSAGVAKKIISSDINTRLLRMRFSVINGQDLASLAVFFG